MATFLLKEHRELVNDHLGSINEQLSRLSTEASSVSIDHDASGNSSDVFTARSMIWWSFCWVLGEGGS